MQGKLYNFNFVEYPQNQAWDFKDSNGNQLAKSNQEMKWRELPCK